MSVVNAARVVKGSREPTWPGHEGEPPTVLTSRSRSKQMASAERKKDILKAAEVELDLALPRDVAIHFEGTDEG